MSWTAQGIRFVLYSPPSAALPEAQDVWSIAFPGDQYETSQRPKGLIIPQTIASGGVGGFQANVTVQPGRLDITANHANDLFLTPGTLPPEPLLAFIGEAGDRCLDALPTFRVAIVLDVLREAGSPDEVMELVKRELPFLPKTEGALDVTFQINHPTPSKSVDNVTIYRLCRWTAAAMQFFNIQGPQQSIPSSLLQQRQVMLLQIDSSNAIPSQLVALDKTQAKAILNDIRDEIGEVLASGYGYLSK